MTSSEEDSLVTPAQQKLLVRVLRDLCAYFGIYYLSAELDVVFTLKEGVLDKMASKTEFQAAIVFLEVSLLVQILIMRSKRYWILQAQI